MSRPDPIQYAERLYDAIRAANFSPISFLAFGNAVKDGVAFRNMPRMAAEPFMRIVGEMLLIEESAEEEEVIDAEIAPVVKPEAPLAEPEPVAAHASENATGIETVIDSGPKGTLASGESAGLSSSDDRRSGG